MRYLTIKSTESSEGLDLNLLSDGSHKAIASCHIAGSKLDELLLALDHLNNLRLHECSETLIEIGEVFAEQIEGSMLLNLKDRCSLPTTIRILVDNAYASRLPWELLPVSGPLGLISYVRLVRIASCSSMESHIRHEIQVALVAADPGTHAYPSLHRASSEIHSIGTHLRNSKNITSTCVQATTKDLLLRTLHSGVTDVFHFVGHGDIRPSGGVLLLQDSQVYASELVGLLKVSNTQIAVLMACSTGGDSQSVGQMLAHEGIPAVVAMQCPISDEGARAFSVAFYTSLTEGHSVEEAVHCGKRCLAGSRDWFAPTIIRSGISPELALVSAPNHNFPSRISRFIGRRAELQDLSDMLTRPGCRLVTLTGMGGMGKTTLGHALGIQFSETLPDGSTLIECESVQSLSELISATATSLKIPSYARGEKDVLDYCRSLKALLVFDCFERIVSLKGFLVTLLSGCPDIKVLVTSRIILDIPGEFEYSLPPMSMKKRKGEVSEAVELFVQASTQFLPAFRLTSSNTDTIKSLVEDLECVPLALTLAAGRLRHYSLTELHNQVRLNRLEVLRRRGDPQDKHLDMHRVIGDSLSLIDESDRVLLGILTVFSGGFYIDDAVEIMPDWNSADSIAWLRDNSLLTTYIDNGRMRYKMLDTVREYMVQSDYAKNLEDFQLKHAERFSQKALELSNISGPNKWNEIAARFPAEAANYHRAVEHACREGCLDLMRTLALSVARIFAEHGHRESFEMIAQFAEQHFPKDCQVMLELRGLQGIVEVRKGNYNAALRFWEDRAEVCQKHEKFEELADTLLDLTNLEISENHFERALELLNRYNAIDPELISTGIRASGLVLRARVLSLVGQEEEAICFAAQAEALLSLDEHTQGHLHNQMTIAEVYWHAGNQDEGVRLMKLTLAQAIQSSHYHSGGSILLTLVDVFETMADRDLAAIALVAGIRIPQNVSPKLKDSFKKRLQLFREQGHGEQFDQTDKLFMKLDWQTVASHLYNEH